MYADCLLSLHRDHYPTQLSLFTPPHVIVASSSVGAWVPTRLSHSSAITTPPQACGQRARSRSQGSRCPDQPPQLVCIFPWASTASASTSTTTPLACSGAVPGTLFSDSGHWQRNLFSLSGIQGLHAAAAGNHSGLTRSPVVSDGFQRSRCCCGCKVAAGPHPPGTADFMVPPTSRLHDSTSPC